MAIPLPSLPVAQNRDPLPDRVREQAENRPGVYWMTAGTGEVLYVGKSVRIRTRLLSYLRADPGTKAAEIVRTADQIHWHYLPDEFAALLLELRMIRRWRPRFNVRHTRSRAPAFIRLTREPAPRILVTSGARRDGSSYFGPFPAPGRLTRTVRELAHVLGLRDCPSSTPIHFRDQLDLLDPGRHPLCYRGEIASCPAPCAGGCTEGDYRRRVDEARAFLEGRSQEPIRQIEAAMVAAARNLRFEHAALLRDRAARLHELQSTVGDFRGERESLSFVYRVPGHEGHDHLYVVRAGRVCLHLPAPPVPRTDPDVRRKVAEALAGPDLPPEEMGPEQADEIVLVARWFRTHPEEWERTEPLARYRS